MDNMLNRAHSEALELLKIVDGFCMENNIVYTLSGITLIALDKIPFENCYPEINIALEYDGFKRIYNFLKEFCKDNIDFSLHDYKNTKQFYTSEMWFIKKSRVKLEKKRQDEEFYYGTHLVITPLYYAGDTLKDWEKTNTFYKNNIFPLSFRRMLKKEPLLIYLKLIPRRACTNKYLKKRNFDNFEQSIRKMEKIQKSEYVFFPQLCTKYSGINISPSMFDKKISKLTLNKFWNNVERIKFCGVECYCVKQKEKLIELYSKQQIKEALTPIKSEILLSGGEELRRVQLIQLELLKEFDRVCRKYDIKYNINFGTLIGAMRHGGFIPWDDDIDITMYYKDCDKLSEIMEKELDHKKYFYRCQTTEKYHHIIFNHLEHKGTTFTKAGRDKLEHKIGVFIDIFPMYPAAPNSFVDFFHTKVCRFWRTALWSTVGADSEKNFIKRWYYRKIATIGTEKCRENFLKHALKFNNRDGRLKFWTSEDRSPYNVDLVRRDNFEQPIEVEFEGIKVYAPKHWKGTLEFCFSEDWDLYPIMTERIPHHMAKMDIGNLYSYEEN